MLIMGPYAKLLYRNSGATLAFFLLGTLSADMVLGANDMFFTSDYYLKVDYSQRTIAQRMTTTKRFKISAALFE